MIDCGSTRGGILTYVVTKCINDLIYKIQLGSRTKPKIVHHDRLWKYKGENPPTWFQAANMCPNPCKATIVLVLQLV